VPLPIDMSRLQFLAAVPVEPLRRYEGSDRRESGAHANGDILLRAQLVALGDRQAQSIRVPRVGGQETAH
jgi:hypothetical protein